MSIQPINLPAVTESSTIADLLRAVTPVETPKVELARESVAVISPELKTALRRFTEVYGAVVLDSRRDLTEKELVALYDERHVMDALNKVINDRKEDIRKMVLNALDVRFEQTGQEASVDSKGHYVVNGALNVPKTHQQFSWEVSEGTPSPDVDAFKSLADDPEIEEINHQDYLDVTVQTRVLDEDKLIEKIKSKPALVKYLDRFVKAGTPRGALYLRKQK